MKKIILIMAVFSAFLSAGVHSKGLYPSGNKYTIWTAEGGSFTISSYEKEDHFINENDKESDYKRVLFRQLNVAAKETQKMGFKYFVITNTNVNNLSGFPINNVNELVRFASLRSRKPSFATDGEARGDSNLISYGGTAIRFKPVPASMLENGLISVWSVDEVLRDTK